MALNFYTRQSLKCAHKKAISHSHMTYAKTVPIEFKSGPSYVKRTTVKAGSHDPTFGANYYSNSKKLVMRINISMT